ncbi:hypothetical protein [Halobaculum rubrum]|uniref:hypothetical protein n=1 Tax=Halobaculum rubrum TaxID=2872158 RepID=UPI001CA3C018|nr:hypothetical protein [Halobaculum rubrum]QZY01166.1 hypothetical protein K6T25_15365 [Halobaculum rubrum]
MSDWGTTPDWEYLGDATVSSAHRVTVPQDVFDREILQHPSLPPREDGTGQAHWSYDTANGWVIISDRELDQDITIQEGNLVEGGIETVRYKSPGRNRYTEVGDEDDNYRVTIPSQFFNDSVEDLSRVPEAVQVEVKEVRHFVTATEFYSDEPTPAKSCYLLTTSQLNTILRDDYDPSAGDTPQFI